MTEIIGSADCGNSPKNRFVQDIVIALEAGAGQGDQFDENVVWTRSLDEQITGRDALIAALSSKQCPIRVIVEHGQWKFGRWPAVSAEIIPIKIQRAHIANTLDHAAIDIGNGRASAYGRPAFTDVERVIEISCDH